MRKLLLLMVSVFLITGCSEDTSEESLVNIDAVLERCNGFIAEHGGDPKNCDCFAGLAKKDQKLAAEMLKIYTPADVAASSDGFKNAAMVCEGRTAEEIEAMGH